MGRAARRQERYEKAKIASARASDKNDADQAALTKKGEQAGHGVRLTRAEVKKVRKQQPGDRY